jgi:excisionase family DNA binding protein
MPEIVPDRNVLTISEVAAILRCSKTHVSHLLNGKVPGVPKLTHCALGRRKLVHKDWLNEWMEARKAQC